MFISFEGIDGSGKSTQARLLAEALRAGGREVVLTREPGGSPGAEEIRRLVLEGDPDRWSAETEILLFTAARRDHLEKTIRPALAAGHVVITDRFADSTRLYQGLSRGDLRGTVDELHRLMIGIEPDLTLIIDMDPAVGLSRALQRMATHAEIESLIAEGNESAEATKRSKALKEISLVTANQQLPEDRFEAFGLQFQHTLREGFLALANEFDDRCVVIEGRRPPHVISDEIANMVRERLR